jgi:uncharacterized protein (DUF433 family)
MADMALGRPPTFPAEIVCDPEIMSGDPVVRGTRIPAQTLLACLRAGMTRLEIFEAYPSLPIDGVEAVVRWAETKFGSHWRTAAE